jgi:hypothetical protein
MFIHTWTHTLTLTHTKNRHLVNPTGGARRNKTGDVNLEYNNLPVKECVHKCGENHRPADAVAAVGKGRFMHKISEVFKGVLGVISSANVRRLQQDDLILEKVPPVLHPTLTAHLMIKKVLILILLICD